MALNLGAPPGYSLSGPAIKCTVTEITVTEIWFWWLARHPDRWVPEPVRLALEKLVPFFKTKLKGAAAASRP